MFIGKRDQPGGTDQNQNHGHCPGGGEACVEHRRLAVKETAAWDQRHHSKEEDQSFFIIEAFQQGHDCAQPQQGYCQKISGVDTALESSGYNQ